MSWAVPKGPSFCTSDKRLAMRVEDHPVDYMDFEGVIPEGEYGGGTVMLWDEGKWIPRTDPERGLREGSLKFYLDGKRLKGDWALVRMKKAEEKQEAWLLIKERDEYVKRTAGISRFTRGVRSGRSMEEIARAGKSNPFRRAEPMLAQLAESLPKSKGWVYELKYDGHRTLGFCEGGRTRLFTRNGHDCTLKFLLAAEGLSKALNGRAAVVDGEMVVAGKDGLPDFSALQAYGKRAKKEGLCYILFDLLALDGEDLRSRPLIERKKKLKALLKGAPAVLSYSEHTEKMTKASLAAIRSRGMEGIVMKRADSEYSAGKNGEWLKLKFRKAEEFVIGGYTCDQEGNLKSLLLGRYAKESLKFCGLVGTGFSIAQRGELKKELNVIKEAPFGELPKEVARGAVWVKPALIAQVEYAEITSSGLLRQASFKGLRFDKDPKEVVEESPAHSEEEEPDRVSRSKRARGPLKRKETSKAKEGEAVGGILITHPEKRMFSKPEITKLELARYYEAVAERMLPHIKGRPLSLVCCPSGIEGERFFRRHLEGEFSGVKRQERTDGEEYFYVISEKGILSLVQYNAVEFHVWGSRKGTPDRPDIMVFDLDPDENLPLKEVRRGAEEMRETLKDLGLISFLKTSGGKGYHVVVPFCSGVPSEKFREFSKRVAHLMETASPDRYTTNMTKSARKGKIYLDWQRNGSSSTSAAPYCVRAREGAAVSMPIGWEELSKVSPDGIKISSALRRLKEPDPWANFFQNQIGAKASIMK